jgi:hypothetical protein
MPTEVLHRLLSSPAIAFISTDTLSLARSLLLYLALSSSPAPTIVLESLALLPPEPVATAVFRGTSLIKYECDRWRPSLPPFMKAASGEDEGAVRGLSELVVPGDKARGGGGDEGEEMEVDVIEPAASTAKGTKQGRAVFSGADVTAPMPFVNGQQPNGNANGAAPTRTDKGSTRLETGTFTNGTPLEKTAEVSLTSKPVSTATAPTPRLPSPAPVSDRLATIAPPPSTSVVSAGPGPSLMKATEWAAKRTVDVSESEDEDEAIPTIVMSDEEEG